MNPADKLEVAWIETDQHPRLAPRVRVEYSDDPAPEDSPRRCLEASLSGCDDPRCGCSHLRFEWRLAGVEPAAAPSLPECAFWFDPDARSARFETEQEKTPTAQRLAEILRAELTTTDLQKLREWFLAWKLAAILTTPPAEINIADLPFADDGAMIGFVEVFPFGLTLNFTWNEVSWAVDDAYCVQTDCSCKETVLVFRKLDGPGGAPVTRISNAPALRYNYQTQAAKWEFKAGAARPVLDGLLPALKRAHPSLNEQLASRHALMQSLYTRALLAPQRPLLESLSDNPPAPAPPRVGRNEPCPCGSGRKFKQCCLNKPPA